MRTRRILWMMGLAVAIFSGLWILGILTGCASIPRVAEMSSQSVNEALMEVKYKSSGELKDAPRLVVGIVVKEGFLLVPAHYLAFVLRQNTPFGLVEIPAEVKERKFYSLENGEKKDGLRLLHENAESDVALMSYPAKYPALEIGDSDTLRVGQKIWMAGHARHRGLLLREGIVARKDNAGWKVGKMNVFIADITVYPGDSGGAMIALQEGRPKLVGMLAGMASGGGLAFALKINEVMKEISPYLKE